ncbi:glycosyl transferase [Oceaniferula spumae]|uniref:Glycosyl transferase n=1 Tax=Oceaniferula spumae TaxID=2979115 RepID=A0AAT9FNS2_9BACT
MKELELVSVIIPCYKMGAYLADALESIAKQTYEYWEVIVVDDCGPEDGTHDAAAAFAAQYSDHRIEYLRLAENKGVSGARNAGAAEAKGEFLAFLDPDDLWRDHHIESHLSEHSTADTAVVTTSRAEYFFGHDSSVVSGEWGYSDWEKSIFPQVLALRNVIVPSTVILPAEQFRQVGGFDEDRSMQHTEDWDLWIRLVGLGIEFRFLQQFTVLYRRHEGGATADRLAMRDRVESFANKNHVKLFSDLGISVWQLSTRVDALEARLNCLQRNPLIRLMSYFQKIIGSGKNPTSSSPPRV